MLENTYGGQLPFFPDYKSHFFNGLAGHAIYIPI